jgi:toxin ParE1/3/4
MRTLTKRAQAERDLEDCFVFIGEQDLDAAVRFLEAAEETFERLARMPYVGAEYQTINPALFGLRRWPVKGFEKYLIFYLTFEDAVDIVRVLHAARDLERILEEGEEQE